VLVASPMAKVRRSARFNARSSHADEIDDFSRAREDDFALGVSVLIG